MPMFSQAAAIRFNFNNIFNKTRSTTTQQSSNNFTPKSMSSMIRTAQCLNITRNFVTMPSEALPALRFAKLSEHAEAPSRGSLKAAGYDLRSAYCYTVQPRSKEIVATDIQVQLPEGCYGRIAPRSGLAAKNGIDVGAGVVDEDYRGNLRVILFNHSDVPFVINKGDRIAQLICERIYYPHLEEVKSLTDTERGEAGFGSTGTN